MDREELLASLETELIAEDCLAKVLPELMAIPAKDIIPLNVRASAAARLTYGVLPKLAPFRERLAHLPEFDLARFDLLDTYATALLAAQSRWNMAVKPNDGLSELVAEAARLRALLLQVAKVLVLRKLVDPRPLKNVLGQRNASALSQDLLLLSQLLTPFLPEVQGSSGVTAQELELADRMSTLLTRLAGRRQRHSRDDIRQAAAIRVRAFTRLAWTYDDTRRAIVYLCGRTQDPDAIIPTLYGKRNRRRKTAPSAPAPLESAPSNLLLPPASGQSSP